MILAANEFQLIIDLVEKLSVKLKLATNEFLLKIDFVEKLLMTTTEKIICKNLKKIN